MNMIIVDVNDIPNVQKEDEVVIIGEQGKEKINADKIAELTGMINYEVLMKTSLVIILTRNNESVIYIL